MIADDGLAAGDGDAAAEEGASPREVELKLDVPPAAVAALVSAPAVQRHARNRGATHRLVSVYWDTPGRALWKAGFTLRVRRKGNRSTLTVKSAGGDDLVSRSEWEVPVAGPDPDLAALLPVLPAGFAAALAEGPLEPVFTADMRRRVRRLDLPGATVEMAVDEGEVRAGDMTEPVSEVELELLEGRPAVLYELALDLMEAGPADISVRSKAMRGFDLAFGRPPAWTRPGRPVIGRDSSLDDAIARMLSAALRHLVENKPAAVDGRDPEGVHQVRVALRRLRSILRLVARTTGAGEAEALGEDAKWLAGCFGAAREWDVFLGETLPPVEAGCAAPGGMAALRERAQARRAAGYAAAREALADARARRFQLALALFVERRGWRSGEAPGALEELAGPAAGWAGRVLDGLYRRVRKRGRRFARLTPEQRHELRLAVKRLRYATDFLQPLCAGGRRAAGFAKSLAGLQDGLGRYNDLATTRPLVEALLDASAGAALAGECGMVLGWQGREHGLVEAELRALWDRFASRRRPWPA